METPSMRENALDPGPLLGTWKNTNPEPRGIAGIELRQRDGKLAVRVHGAGGADGWMDWGEAEGDVFAKCASSREAMAFSARYDLGFQIVELQANIKQGVLVVASFHEIRDGSGRSSYFAREFFFR